jgi:hypothetical protein
MEVILMALKLLGHKQEAEKIHSKWTNLLNMTGSKQNELYRKACPADLLELAVVHSLEGVKGMGCRLADSNANGRIHEILNDAWSVFWQDPQQYLNWEKMKLNELRQRYAD